MANDTKYSGTMANDTKSVNSSLIGELKALDLFLATEALDFLMTEDNDYLMVAIAGDITNDIKY